MDGHIVGSMISANSITGEQIQANSIKTANLELSAQQKIQNATDEETVKALIKADLDGFESTLSKEFVTVENATTQIQQATEVAVKEATQNIIDNAVSESMGAVDGQLNDKLNQYTSGTLLPAINEKAEEVLQNAEDYVVTQLESYATKQELSSSISQTREQIELSVSEKYTTKSESTTIVAEAIEGITVGAINRVFGTGESKSFNFNGGANEIWLPYKFSNDISDKEAYVSFNYTLTGTAQNGSQIEFAPSYLKKTNNKTVYQPKNIFFASDRLQDVNISDTLSFVTRDFKDISPSSTSYIRFVGNGFTGTLSISEVQIKPGNSKTSWSPAPEDVDNNISDAKNEAITTANDNTITVLKNYYTKTETDSQIAIAEKAITSSVSSTYETKTEAQSKIDGVNSSISSLTNRVSTAESKITDTAITNTVSQKFYTKTETDGKVTEVQSSMDSSITQLSNQIATKVDVNGVKSTIEQNPSSVQIGFNKISDALTVSADGLVAKTQSGNKYFQLGYNGMTMYNPANGTHQWGKVAAINNKFTVASNGNSSGLSLGHHVNENYVEDILCDSNGVVSVQRQMNHNGVFYNNYGQMFVRQPGQGGWEITGRSDSQSIKPGGANQGSIGSNTQYINQSWIANRQNPSSFEYKHLSHYVEDLECIKLVSEVQPARYFYKEYDEEGNDITTFTTRTSQLGLIYEDVRECEGRDLITNEEDKAINLYNMVSTLWGATRNINTRLNEVEYENILLRERVEHLESLLKKLKH